MVDIIATTVEGKRRETLAEWVEDKAAVLVDEINADLVALDDSPTNAEVVAVLRRTMVRQRKIINGVVRLVTG